MCKCNPSIRAPFCGAPGCDWPDLAAADPLNRMINALAEANPGMRGNSVAAYYHSRKVDELMRPKRQLIEHVASYELDRSQQLELRLDVALKICSAPPQSATMKAISNILTMPYEQLQQFIKQFPEHDPRHG